MRVCKLTEDTKCTTRLRCDQIILEYTHHEYYDRLLTHGDCNGRASTDDREFPIFCLGDVIQTLVRFNVAVACQCAMQRDMYRTCECRSSIDCAHITRERCHNCSCETRDAITAAMGRELCASRDIIREPEMPKARVLEALNHNLNATLLKTTRRTCFQHLIPCAFWRRPVFRKADV
jgi:hypothetical protein